MPDIAMCETECRLSQSCYRHKDSGTKPCDYQAYMAYKPDTDETPCMSYWSRTRR